MHPAHIMQPHCTQISEQPQLIIFKISTSDIVYAVKHEIFEDIQRCLLTYVMLHSVVGPKTH